MDNVPRMPIFGDGGIVAISNKDGRKFVEEYKNQENLTVEELEEKQRRLEERERELDEKASKLHKAEDAIAKAKYSLYDRIDVSLGTMNKVVAVLAVSLVIALVVGIVYR